MTHPDPAGYWHQTDLRIRLGTIRDQQAARWVNAQNILRDAAPFGRPCGASGSEAN